MDNRETAKNYAVLALNSPMTPKIMQNILGNIALLMEQAYPGNSASKCLLSEHFQGEAVIRNFQEVVKVFAPAKQDVKIKNAQGFGTMITSVQKCFTKFSQEEYVEALIVAFQELSPLLPNFTKLNAFVSIVSPIFLNKHEEVKTQQLIYQ
jgi:hypothetical protein